MTTVTAFGLPAAASWSVAIGGGWIVLMLVGMAVCCLGMVGLMWFARGRHGFGMCGPWRLHEPLIGWHAERDDSSSDNAAASSSEHRGVRGSESEA